MNRTRQRTEAFHYTLSLPFRVVGITLPEGSQWVERVAYDCLRIVLANIEELAQKEDTTATACILQVIKEAGR